MSYKLTSPLSTGLFGVEKNKKNRHDLSRKNREKIKVAIGRIVGVSSPDEGFGGSNYDTVRDYFKFRVFFEKEQRIEWVIPDLDKEYFYEKFGYCQAAYEGTHVKVEYTGNTLPKLGEREAFRGKVDVGDLKKEKMEQAAIVTKMPEISLNKEIYATNENPLEESMGFTCAGFSGIIDDAASYLISKLT